MIAIVSLASVTARSVRIILELGIKALLVFNRKSINSCRTIGINIAPSFKVVLLTVGSRKIRIVSAGSNAALRCARILVSHAGVAASLTAFAYTKVDLASILELPGDTKTF